MALELVQETHTFLNTERFGKPLIGYPSIPSTNTEALKRAQAGAPEALVNCKSGHS